MTEVLGLGHDVVDLDGFSEQLALPGSRMHSLFSPRELRQAAMRAELKHDSETAHLAVRWAGKEAVLKAWSQALGDRPAPYTVDDFPWAGVEILDDSRGRPGVHLREDVQSELMASVRSGMGERACFETDRNEEIAGGYSNNEENCLDTGSHHTVSRLSPNEWQSEQSKGNADDIAMIWHLSVSHDGPVASAVALLCIELFNGQE
ncbi:4'-phosphopantetheinyl transferase superfamily protein [Bifidobacterium favimelis]